MPHIRNFSTTITLKLLYTLLLSRIVQVVFGGEDSLSRIHDARVRTFKSYDEYDLEFQRVIEHDCVQQQSEIESLKKTIWRHEEAARAISALHYYAKTINQSQEISDQELSVENANTIAQQKDTIFDLRAQLTDKETVINRQSWELNSMKSEIEEVKTMLRLSLANTAEIQTSFLGQGATLEQQKHLYRQLWNDLQGRNTVISNLQFNNQHLQADNTRLKKAERSRSQLRVERVGDEVALPIPKSYHLFPHAGQSTAQM